MQVIFNLLGRCRSGRSTCVHYDGDFIKTPCRSCERNPRLIELKDQYLSESQMNKTVTEAVDKIGEVVGEPSTDAALDSQNDRIFAEYGIDPAASRAASRAKRPDIA